MTTHLRAEPSGLGKGLRIGAVVAVFGVSGCSDLTQMQSVLHPGGNDAAVISHLAWLLFGGGTVIFIGVMVVLALSLRRRKEGDAPRIVHPGRWIIGAGIVFPVVVLSALLTYSIVRSKQLTEPHSQDALVISVTAKMWWWQVRYRDLATGRELTTANEIHLPVGRPVYFALTSDDVIHSFWVPALAGKVDMLPGRITRLRVTADRAGVFRGQCAEYCGEQHARMALHVVAKPPAEFDTWLAAQLQPAAPPANDLLEVGRKAFIEQRCSACHTIRGVSETPAGGPLGPDLTHIGSRLYLGAGVLNNGQQSLAEWIAYTQHFKPGARMPAAAVDEETLFALSSYLESLK